MLYTVKEVADLSGTTVKTLHHYNKKGLLRPAEDSEAGYRLYGMPELERCSRLCSISNYSCGAGKAPAAA